MCMRSPLFAVGGRCNVQRHAPTVIAQLEALKAEVASLQKEVDAKQAEKASLQKQIADKQAELAAAIKDQDATRERLKSQQ